MTLLGGGFLQENRNISGLLIRPHNTWHVSASGDSNPAHGTLANPWSLTYAGAGGGGNIVPGDTILLHDTGGVYRGSGATVGFTISVSGEAKNPIVFKAAPGEFPELRGSFSEFETVGNSAWTVFGSQSSGHNVYVSAAAYSAFANATNAVTGGDQKGGFIQFAGVWHSLICHPNGIAYLVNDNQNWNVTPNALFPDPLYMGYGLTWNPVRTAVAALSIASPALLTWGGGTPTDHFLYPGDKFQLTTTGALPTGVLANTDYYVLDGPLIQLTPTIKYNSYTFHFAATPGGTPINTSGNQSGVHTVHTGDDKIYIRLDLANSTAQFGRSVPVIANTDPRQNALYLFPASGTGITITANYITFGEGITINFYNTSISPTGTGIVLQGDRANGRPFYCRHGYTGLKRNVTTPLTIGDGVVIDGCQPSLTMPLAWADVKGGSELPAKHNRKLGLDLSSSANVTVGAGHALDTFFNGTATVAAALTNGSCSIVRGCFDGILAGGQANHIKLLGVWFDNIWDDAWQQYAELYDVEVGYCVAFGASFSQDKSGTGAVNGDPGTLYLHDLLIDATRYTMLWGRPGSPAPYIGVLNMNLSETHGSPANTGFRHMYCRKMWNCTLIGGNSTTFQDAYVPLTNTTDGPDPTKYDAVHEFYNNVLVNKYPIGRDSYANTGKEIYDGDVFWTTYPASGVVPGIFRFLHTSTGLIDAQVTDITTFAHIRATQALADSQVYYGPGWEATGLIEDPALDANYKPTNVHLKTGAVDLTGKGWPGTATPRAWRGAINPT